MPIEAAKNMTKETNEFFHNANFEITISGLPLWVWLVFGLLISGRLTIQQQR